MNIIDITGTLAAVISTLAFLPQVIKAHVTKETKDLSLGMYALLSVGLILWLIYGIMLRVVPVIAANGIVLIFALYILYLKVKNG